MTSKWTWNDGRRRQPLPIDGYLGQILSTLRDNQVVIVEAETGAGKTTRIPQAILLDNPRVLVPMTQTRRPAVRWNGRRIAYELGEQPGQTVGWRLRGEAPRVSQDTRVTLVVDQSMVNRVRQEGRLPEGVIIVDEAHERPISIDLLLGLIKEYLPKSSKTRVVVTSATIDTQKFSEYFGGAPVISVPGRVYPVEVLPYKMPLGSHHSNCAADAACGVMDKFAKGELSVPGEQEENERIAVTSGSVLVLLPGKEDITNTMSSLEQRAKNLAMIDRIQILACHGEVSGEDQDMIQATVLEGTLRFVVATEIVRSSVTVPQTVGVIDSLQVKRLITDAKGVAHLQKVAISKAEADQAKGRAGRTQPGFYIPVSYRGEYGSLRRYPEPAILREPIASVVLQVAAIGLSVRTFPFIDAPNVNKVDIAITRLQKIGALDADEAITELGRTLVHFPIDPERARVLITADELGVLAEAIIATAVLEVENIRFRPREREGKVAVSEILARQIIAQGEGQVYMEGENTYRVLRPEEVDLNGKLPDWIEKIGEHSFEVDCGSFDFPHREGVRWIADLVWQGFADESGSDFVAAVNAYRAFKVAEVQIREMGKKLRAEKHARLAEGFKEVDVEDIGTDDKSKKIRVGSGRWVDEQIFQWCKRNFLNYKRLRMVQFTISQLREEVANSPLRLQNGINHQREFSSEALTKALASGQVDNVARNSRDRTFDGPMGDGIQLAYSSACPGSSELILIGGVRKIAGKKSSYFLLADMAAPVKGEWLRQVMPQLCLTKLKENARYDVGQDRVLATEELWYENVKIASYPVPIQGESAVSAFALALSKTNPEGRINHVCLMHNKAVVAEVNDLRDRSGNKWYVWEQDLAQWYASQLGNRFTLSQAVDLNLSLSDADVSKILGIDDYAGERARIRAERPDTWTVKDRPYDLSYGGYGGSSVTIRLPLALVAGLQVEELPQWEGMDVQVYASDEHYTYTNVTMPGESLDDLREKIEAKRLELVWSAFLKDGHGGHEQKMEIAFAEPLPQPLPALPQPEVWDAQTGSLAYPAHKCYGSHRGAGDERDGTKWNIIWFQKEHEADELQEKSAAKKIEVDEEIYQERHFEELKAEAQTLYGEVADLWEQMDAEKYAAYGLTERQVEDELSYDLKEAERWSGRGYSADPARALEALTSLKEQLIEALARFAENETQEPAAKQAIETARVLVEQVRSLHENGSVITWSKMDTATGPFAEAETAYDGGDYSTAIERAGVALATAQAVLAEESTRNQINKLIKSEYSVCPACDYELYDDETHDCYESGNITYWVGGTDEEIILKSSKVGDTSVIELVANFYSRDYVWAVKVRVNRDVVIGSDDEVVTGTHYQVASAQEVKRFQQERQAVADREEYEYHLKYALRGGTRLKLSFRRGEHRGEVQWQSSGKGYKYVLDSYCHYEPTEGAVYYCRPGRELVNTGTFILTTVHIEPPYPEDAPAADDELEESESSENNATLGDLMNKFGQRRRW